MATPDSVRFLFHCIDSTQSKPNFKVVGAAMGINTEAARMRFKRLKDATESGQLAAQSPKHQSQLRPMPTASPVMQQRLTKRKRYSGTSSISSNEVNTASAASGGPAGSQRSLRNLRHKKTMYTGEHDTKAAFENSASDCSDDTEDEDAEYVPADSKSTSSGTAKDSLASETAEKISKHSDTRTPQPLSRAIVTDGGYAIKPENTSNSSEQITRFSDPSIQAHQSVVRKGMNMSEIQALEVACLSLTGNGENIGQMDPELEEETTSEFQDQFSTPHEQLKNDICRDLASVRSGGHVHINDEDIEFRSLVLKSDNQSAAFMHETSREYLTALGAHMVDAAAETESPEISTRSTVGPEDSISNISPTPSKSSKLGSAFNQMTSWLR